MLFDVGWNFVLAVAAVTFLVCAMVSFALKGHTTNIEETFVEQVSYLIKARKARISQAFTEAEVEAMTSRKKLEGRQAPRHLEKMLLTNYREEERLQRQLQDLNKSSRLRGMELDREKTEVHNEMRLSRRRNSAPALAAELAASSQGAQRLLSRDSWPAAASHARQRNPSEIDPVNEYLLTEFKKVSEVIPNILNSLNKQAEDKPAGGVEGQKRGSRWSALQAAGRRGSLAGVGGTTPLAAPKIAPDDDLSPPGMRQTPGEPRIANIVNMIRKIKALRGEMAANKRVDLVRSKTSFKDLLKNIQEEESKPSDSDTYTDGACVLLRRKMYKARRASCPVIDVAVAGAGPDTTGSKAESSLPKRASAPHPLVSTVSGTPTRMPPPVLARSSSSMALLGRLDSREAESCRRALLQQEDKELTDLKVATEWHRYDQLRKRIGHFLSDVPSLPRQTSVPGPHATDGQEEPLPNT